MPRAIAILTTTAPPDAAAAMAETLLSERLAACVQTTEIASRYRWDGAIEMADEVRLDAKTAIARVSALAARVATLHPYEVPEIGWTEFAASDAYGDWIEAETR